MGQQSFASLLRTRRAVSGLTQEELASRAGVSPRAVSYLESGTVRRPRRDTIDALANALGLDERQRDELRDRARGHRGTGDPTTADDADRLTKPAIDGYPTDVTWPGNAGRAGDGPSTRNDAGLPTSHQLPPDVSAFVGRHRQTAELREEIDRGDVAGPIAIVGMPGVGTSTLALHIGYQVRDRYPDAQLFVDLHAAGRPLEPRHALARFLRALGVPGQRIPPQLHERAAAFRSLLTGRRCLIVLDNAADERQVRPLLPADPACLTLITSGNALTGLDVRRRITLPPPPPAESMELLARIAGPARLAEDPAACAELIRLCGGLPLAVRIAAAQLAARPDQDTATLVRRLAAIDHRLDQLSAGDLAVRESFARRYHTLDRTTRRLFHALGQLDGTRRAEDGWADLTTEQVAVVARTPPATVVRGLGRLLDAHLLQPGREPDGYRAHELIRLYAAERARAVA